LPGVRITGSPSFTIHKIVPFSSVNVVLNEFSVIEVFSGLVRFIDELNVPSSALNLKSLLKTGLTLLRLPRSGRVCCIISLPFPDMRPLICGGTIRPIKLP